MSLTVLEHLGPEPMDETIERVPSWHIASEVLSAIEVRYSDGEFFAEGMVSCGFDEHFTDLVGITYDDLDEYANKHARLIELWFEQRYGCLLENESWQDLMARFTIQVSPDVALDEVASLIESRTHAIKLYNESDPGTFNTEDLWRILAKHLTN